MSRGGRKEGERGEEVGEEEAEEHDKYSRFFYKPHFLLALSTGTVGLFHVAFYSRETEFKTNVKRGLLGVCCAFLLYCSLPSPFPRSVFRRPHPLFWRLVAGASILYLMVLTFILFQTVDDARTLVTYVDPCRNGLHTCSQVTMIGRSEGVSMPLPERSYADDCRVVTGGPMCKWWADLSKGEEPCFGNLQGAIQDEFVVAHVLGWWGKALIIRHAGAAWLNSIVFEFVEMSFEHWMPNFAECWWDHIILDVLTCNLLGICLGHLFMHWLAVKQYRWMHISEIPTPEGKFLRVLGQFSPESWDTYHWDALESPKRLLVVILTYACILLCDFNAFALKFILWIPPRNPLNTYRLLLWWLLGMCAVREFYEYSTNRRVKRLGHHAWLGGMILITETMIWVKFGIAAKEFTKPFPSSVVISWSIALALFLMWFAYHFYLVPNRLKRKKT